MSELNYIEVRTLNCRGTKDPNEINAGNLNTADPWPRGLRRGSEVDRLARFAS